MFPGKKPILKLKCKLRIFHWFEKEALPPFSVKNKKKLNIEKIK